MSIKIEGLSHIFNRGTTQERIALHDISLEIAKGMRIGIAGRSGSGKTTLIQHLNGLLRPTSGKVWVNGLDVTGSNLKELKPRIGIVFQHPEHQFFEETAYGEIAFGMTGWGLSAGEIDTRVREASKAVGLDEKHLGRSPFSLSAGEKRRVAIAGVIVTRPEILVLDEPGAALDPQGRREILDLISGLQRELGCTLIMVTHNMDDLVRICDRVLVLKDGAVALEGETRQVFRDIGSIERAGLAAPQITCLMEKLKRFMPEVDEVALTVEEARDALLKRWERKREEKRLNDERYPHGEIFPRRFDYSQDGPEDKISPDCNLHVGSLSCRE